MKKVKLILGTIGLGLIGGVSASLTLRYFFHVIQDEQVIVIKDPDHPPSSTQLDRQGTQLLEPSPLQTQPDYGGNSIPQTQHLVPMPKQGIKKGIFTLDGPHIHILRQDLNKLLAEDIESITKTALIQPYRRDGLIKGFQLIKQATPSIWSDMGLIPGDVFTSINNRPLNNAAEALALLRAVRKMNLIHIIIQRDGSYLERHIYLH